MWTAIFQLSFAAYGVVQSAHHSNLGGRNAGISGFPPVEHIEYKSDVVPPGGENLLQHGRPESAGTGTLHVLIVRKQNPRLNKSKHPRQESVFQQEVGGGRW